MNKYFFQFSVFLHHVVCVCVLPEFVANAIIALPRDLLLQ